MKKYIGLLSVTAMVILAFTLWGNAMKSSVAAVKTIEVIPTTTQETVICSGKIERVSSKKVYPAAMGVIKDLRVKVGDTVNIGDTLLTVEPVKTDLFSEDTISVYASLYGNAEEEKTSSDVSSETKIITAPISGKVVSLSVAEDEYADPTKAMMVISGELGLQLRLNVSESKIADIEIGQKAEITGSGFKNSIYYGTVKSIASEAKQIITTTGQENIVEVVLSIENPGEDIKPGYSANGKIVISESETFVVPYEAVQAEEDGSEYVYIQENGEAVKRYVTTGSEYENGISITKGLHAGELILADSSSVSEGQHVKETERIVIEND